MNIPGINIVGDFLMSRALASGLSAMECAATGGALAAHGHPGHARRHAQPKRRHGRRSPKTQPLPTQV